jgi:hypothetical protein
MYLTRTQVLQVMQEKGPTCCSQDKTWIYLETCSNMAFFHSGIQLLYRYETLLMACIANYFWYLRVQSFLFLYLIISI